MSKQLQPWQGGMASGFILIEIVMLKLHLSFPTAAHIRHCYISDYQSEHSLAAPALSLLSTIQITVRRDVRSSSDH